MVWKGNLEKGKSSSCGRCASRLRLDESDAVYAKVGIEPRHVERLSDRFYAMRSRCVGGSRPHVQYAGRGVECRFKSAEDFIRHAITVTGWDNPKLHTDRIDNDGHYEPGNIRFITCAANQRNKQGNIWVEYLGQRMVVEDFHRQYAPLYRDCSTVRRKLAQGLTPEQIIEDQALCRGEYLRCAERRSAK